MEEIKPNEKQLEAITHVNGPLLIIAGAGTGKTKVITQRIANLIKDGHAKPSEILALTFTEKAANEMKERVDSLLPISYEEPWISTFHSFCDSLLRAEGIYIGLDTNYKLMTPAESYILFRRSIFDMSLDILRPLGNPAKNISAIISHFSRLGDEDVSYEEYISYANSLPETTDSEKQEKLQKIELAIVFKEWKEIKQRESRLEFSDLITYTLELFRKRPNILEKYHKKYKYILVDEFQDTNYSQNVLVNILALNKISEKVTKEDLKNANICVVGDDDQAIYKFRGAAISNILQFKQKYTNAKSIVLTMNYRSSQQILDTAYRLITNNNPYRLEITEKIDKRLISSKKDTGEVSLLLERTSHDESERVADEIFKLVGKKSSVDTKTNIKGQIEFGNSKGEYTFKDIAILTRAHSHSDEIVDTLKSRGIPYKIGGSKSLYQRQEIQILTSFLKTLTDYTDENSFLNILSMEEWKLFPRDVVEIIKEAKKRKCSVIEVLESATGKKIGGNYSTKQYVKISSKSINSIMKILEIYNKGMKMIKDGRSAGEILFMFFEDSGLKNKYVNDDTGKFLFAVENTKKYFDMLNSFWETNPTTNIYEYLDYLKYSIDVGEGPVVDESLDDFDGVNIMTIHSAKGLEFPVVFVMNMVNDRFPSRGNNRNIQLPVPNALIKEFLSGTDETNEELSEERRLCYVAYTRAKEKLYLTAATYYGAGKQKKKPSVFLGESLEKDIDAEFDLKAKSVTTTVNDIFAKESKDNFEYAKLGIDIPNEFSYSQISLYERCPLQYKYEYILGLPSMPNGATSFGTTIHNTLKQLYEQTIASKGSLEGFIQKPGLNEALAYYEKSWISVGYESKKHEMKRYESGKELVKNYFKNIYKETDNPIEIEKSFRFSIDDFIIKGRIDRIDLIREEDGIKVVSIVDYKTGHEKKQEEVQKDWQLQLYAYVVEKTMGYKVDRASYVFVEHGSRVDAVLKRDKIDKVINHIREIVQKIREGEFSVPKGHECSFCGHICDNPIV